MTFGPIDYYRNPIKQFYQIKKDHVYVQLTEKMYGSVSAVMP